MLLTPQQCCLITVESVTVSLGIRISTHNADSKNVSYLLNQSALFSCLSLGLLLAFPSDHFYFCIFGKGAFIT